MEEGEEKSDDEETMTVMEETVLFSTKDQSPICVMLQDFDCLVGSEITHHATSRRDAFVTYRTGDFGAAKMGNKDV